MAYLGIDVGTQSLKAVVLDANLRLLGSGSVGYQPSFPRPGWAEQDPSVWSKALRPAIAAALSAASVAADGLSAVAICGQLDGCIPVDNDNVPLGPAILWMDRRADSLLGGIEAPYVHRTCGLVCDATHMGAKIAWHTQQAIRNVARWHQPVTFLVAQLTGRSTMARSLASTTMLYDVQRRDWDESLVAAFGANRAQLPELGEDTEMAGYITDAGAELSGLPPGLPVAIGTGDDFSNLIGASVTLPGTIGVSLGTAETVGALATSPIIDPQMLVETHAFPGGLYHLGNPGWLSGGAVRWAQVLLAIDNDTAFSALAASAPPGADGVRFLPTLSGAMAPKWIGPARGAFLGLTPSHGRAHMARAVFEGTAFAMRDVIDRLAALGLPIDRLRLVGGGARSVEWCQIRADLTGLPTEIVDAGDASATGAALIAAVAVGAWDSLGVAADALSLPIRHLVPDPAKRAAYDAAYHDYRAHFVALEPLWLSES